MLRTVIFAAVMLTALALATANPFAALMAYIWYGLFRPENWLWIDVSGFRFSLVLGAILIVRSLSAGALPNLSHRLSFGIVLFLVSGLVAQINAVPPDIGGQWLLYFARLALVCLLLVTLVNTKSRLFYTVLIVSASFGCVTAHDGLVSILTGGSRVVAGPQGAYSDNNGYALAAVMIMPMLLVCADTLPAKWQFKLVLKWVLRGAAVATAFLIIGTFSRGGFVAFAVGLLMYLGLLFRKRMRAFVVVAAAVVAAGPFVTLPTGYSQRVGTIFSYEEVGDISAISRLHFWRVAIDMAIDRPLGVGLKNFEANFNQYDFSNSQYGHARSVHNSHLQVLAETGFFGFAVWVGLFISAIRTCLRWRRVADRDLAGTEDGVFLWKMSGALAVSMMAFAAGGTFIALSLNDLTWITFAMVAALDLIGARMIAARRSGSAPARREFGVDRIAAAVGR